MARYFSLLLSALLLFSCQEGGEAGDLFGQWRMDGSDRQYISFSGSIVLFRSIGEGEVYGTFRHEGDSLFLQCRSVHGLPSDTALVERTFGFRPFADIRLKVSLPASDCLVLSQGTQQWKFYQY